MFILEKRDKTKKTIDIMSIVFEGDYILTTLAACSPRSP